MNTSVETRDEAAIISQIRAYRNALVALWSYRLENMEQPKQDSILALAKKVTELAEHKTSNGSVPQREFMEAIQRLQIAVEGPAHYVARMRHQPVEFISTLLAVESGVLQALVDSAGKPLSAQELAAKTKVDPLLITSKISALLKNNQFTQFPDYSKGEKSPFIWTHSINQWDMMRGDPDLKLAFDGYMPARREGLRSAWHEIYPAATELNVPGFQQAQEPPLLVDVGGNTGYDAASFKTKNPQIRGRCVVQDLPETLANSPEPAGGVEKVAYDFFTEQPIKGARAYFFKAVCHDFDDADCQKLLGNTVAAMGPDSSLLIDDWVLPDVGAPLAGASEDMFMLMLLSGMERSESQWSALLESVGLEIKKIWRTDGVSEAVIEARRRLEN
ncbi:MAG: hypothetical protein Q9195_005515 [Heterodermia aff. obscurata]